VSPITKIRKKNKPKHKSDVQRNPLTRSGAARSVCENQIAVCSTTVPAGTRLHWCTRLPTCTRRLRPCCGREVQWDWAK